jgi:hypothetical protein
VTFYYADLRGTKSVSIERSAAAPSRGNVRFGSKADLRLPE